MLKDISSIKLQGANFSKVVKLPLLASSNNKYVRISLLYGRNGSGKSTIAKTFRKIKGENISAITTVDFLNEENQSIVLSKTECEKIFVFDEDFVTSNVRIEEIGLNSIVMLGEQVNLNAQIEKAEVELKKAEDLVKKTSDALKEYTNNKNPKSPQFYIDKIREILQREDGWAGRERKVKELRRNPSVNDETYKRFTALTPEKSKNELIIAFDIKMNELGIAKSGVSRIDEVVSNIPDIYRQYPLDLANEIIKKTIEKPELSEREQYLLSLVTEGKTSELQSHIDDLNNENVTFCPYCLQDLTTNYKRDLVTRIKKVLSDEVKHHQAKLQSLEYSQLTLNLLPFSKLTSYKLCINLITLINDILVENNALLQRKIKAPYSPILEEKLSGISEQIVLLEEALEKLEKERKNHNSQAMETKAIVKELTFINSQIAYYEILDFVEQLNKQTKEMNSAQKAYDNAIADRNLKKKILDDLNGRRKSIDIAVDILNNGLKYIFFTEKRLIIEREGEYYKILSNGLPVLPKNVSVGERNIIGLCYFFASMMTDKNKKTAYNNEYLIVIDDPISSYDFENKIGILSFIKHKLSQFLNGNMYTRSIIMTHDLLAFFDIEKVCQELSEDWKPKTIYQLWELNHCLLERLQYKKRQEYTELLKLIYEYGCGNNDEYNIVIGNVMRQALEAFSTFEYKKGIEKISNDNFILAGMCDEYKAYFKNLMYRIVLNNGSHREEQTQSMELDFLSVISESEKKYFVLSTF